MLKKLSWIIQVGPKCSHVYPFFLFWLCFEACSILLGLTRIEPMSPAVEVWSQPLCGFLNQGNPMCILTWRKQRETLHTERKLCGSRTKTDLKMLVLKTGCSYQPRNIRSSQKMKKVRKRFSPRIPGRGTALPTPWFIPENHFRLLISRTLGE